MIGDRAWLEGEFIETIQKRGAAVIAKRGQSSATSAAHAIIDSVNSIHTPTPGDDFHSVAVVSSGEYGVPEGLQFGFPVRSAGPSWSVVEGIEHDDFAVGQDRRDDSRARRGARRSPRPARELMPTPRSGTEPARYALRFEQADGVNGAVQLDLYDDHASYWVYLDLGNEGFVAIRHDDVALPRGTLLEVRGDGLWAEIVCEVPDEHWTFGLEAFGLRLDDRDEAAPRGGR